MGVLSFSVHRSDGRVRAQNRGAVPRHRPGGQELHRPAGVLRAREVRSVVVVVVLVVLVVVVVVLNLNLHLLDRPLSVDQTLHRY